jgi:uncharacterized protein (DUF433 family)
VLEEEDVKVIFQRLQEGEKGAAIARDFAISQQSISAIKTGKSWGHVTGLGDPPDPRSRIVNSKLTEEQVLDIDSRLKAGEPIKTIAARYGVCYGTVREIKLGLSWAWLTGRQQEGNTND